MLTFCTHDVMIFGEMHGKLASKKFSGNKSRALNEKMMKWVFQTPAKDRD